VLIRKIKNSIISVIPMSESSYYYTTLPSSVKLSKNLIFLNYKSKSPFSKTSIFSYKKKEHLSLWFSLKQSYSTLFIVPEGFLIFNILKNFGDGLYCVSINKDFKVIAYLKNDILLSEFILNDLNKLDLLEKEYKQKTKYISYDEYKNHTQKIWTDLNFLLELKQFLNLNFSKDKLVSLFEKKFYYPSIYIIVLYILISYYQANSLENKIELLMENYQQLKNKNSKVKQVIYQHNEKVKRLNKFIKDELYYQDPIKIISLLSKVIYPNDDAKITFLSITPNTMKIKIKTKDSAIKYFKRLNALGYFKNILIENTYKQQNGEKIYTYFLSLKV